MKRLNTVFLQLMKGMSAAAVRFPFTVLCLVAAAGIICYIISLRTDPPLLIEKLTFTMAVGAMLGMVTQFLTERFEKLSGKRLLLHGGAVLLTIAYFGILWPAPEISSDIIARTFVAIFSMICFVLWIPSIKEKADFNKVTLIHFKSLFTSLLYSAVISAGISAILFAVDRLLFRINTDSYAYTMAFVWVVFAPVFYLSLLPPFNSKIPEDDEIAERKSQYPKFLEILVSYIAIPLFAAYTLVLLAYFIKILITTVWPSGLLGPMVLVYSAIGLILFILASLLENRFAAVFRKFFPKVWIPIVVMQLVSVWIRLNSYGITESRYYVVLFGIFSIVTGIILSLRPVKMNRSIALLAAGFAIFSVLPPVDAFTVSRNSQIDRVEQILQSEGMLSGGKITPNKDASEKSKTEISNILSYLDVHSSLKYISWLPKDFDIYRDMENVLGFKPVYPTSPGEQSDYFYASLYPEIPLDISGYDTSVIINSYRKSDNDNKTDMPFTLDGVTYKISCKRSSEFDVRVSVEDDQGKELIGANLYDLSKQVKTRLVLRRTRCHLSK